MKVFLGRLLTGYGELELQMCSCLIAVEGIFDVPIRTIFSKSVRAEQRIRIAKRVLKSDFANAGLLADLSRAMTDLNWCREIRNQYSHCHWYWTPREGLCFVNLEELARQPTTISSLMAIRHPIDVALLTAQEEYFWYVKQCFMHLEAAYKAWDRTQARSGPDGPALPVYPKPTNQKRPAAHN
jgi:hypothetical protein